MKRRKKIPETRGVNGQDMGERKEKVVRVM